MMDSHLERYSIGTAGVLTDPRRQWEEIRRIAMGNRRVAFRSLDVDWKKYTTDEYLFTHDTACCSVETEENGYWIKPACWELINANGNAWTTPVLLGCFRTFIGGDNFLEHLQVSSLSKGKILDAIARPVVHHSEKYGDANIYVVDLLIATNRKHAALVEKIESGKMTGLSMGCLANVTQCSICGKKIYDGDRNCEHLEKQIGKMVRCSDGEERMCAELCGCTDENGEYEKGSCEFIECSFVQHPAWPYARVNYFVETPAVHMAREQERDELAKLFEGNLFERLKTASREDRIALKITGERTRLDRVSKAVSDDIGRAAGLEPEK